MAPNGDRVGVTGGDGPRYSVVLVDDSSDLRKVVAQRLEHSGLFRVVAEGGDGDEAISLAIRHEPDLMLLDTSMPTCDGIQALPGIVAVAPSTTVVMFTGFHEASLAARARELGAADFVEKSIPLEQLPGRLLRTMMEWPGPAPERARDGQADLAPRGKDQQLLDEHVAQFRDLFDQAAIGMATLTVTGTVVRANGALARMMSCRPADLVGEDYGRLTSGMGDALDRALAQLGDGEDLVVIEHRLPAVSDTVRGPVVRLSLAPIRDERGQVLYVFAQVQDISALRAIQGDLRTSERLFRLLVEAVDEYALFLLDVQGNVISWNSGARRIKGYAAHEIVGRSFRVFYPPEDQANGHPEHNLQVALHEGVLAEEGWRIRKDGSRFWASVVITPVRDDQGVHIGFAKVTRDHSRQREHEEERAALVTEQRQLLAVTAHELRTPTAVIEGSLAALEDGDVSPAGRRQQRTNIRASVQRLRRLAVDLAALANEDSESVEYPHEQVLMEAVLGAAVARAAAAGREVELDLDVPDDTPLRVDPQRFGQALDNLLDNAARHGRPPVRLLGTVSGEQVRIRVTDAGSGAPADLQSQLFDRFSRAGRRSGTGLGLYLVKQIAREHQGDVAYHASGPDGPTWFELRLPLA